MLTSHSIDVKLRLKGWMMISRFFKKKTKKQSEAKQATSEQSKTKKDVQKEENSVESQRLLTAEGWKRLMMRKSGKNKK